MLEILDRGALAQKFRVRHYLDVGVAALVAQDALDLVAGSNGDGRFCDHHRGGGQQRRDLAHRVIDETQIGMAVAAARRRADRDEHRLGGGDGGGVDGEAQALLTDIGLDQIGEARLENRNLAAIEGGYLLRILVDAGHVVAEIGKAGAGHQPHITCADHGHAHRFFVLKLSFIRPGGRRRRAFECVQRRCRRSLRLGAHQRQPTPAE